MSEFAELSFSSSHYDNARPTYPLSFIKQVATYARKGPETSNCSNESNGNTGAGRVAIDIGCGTGQVTFPLAKYFSKVIGVDPSARMIEQCNLRLAELNKQQKSGGGNGGNDNGHYQEKAAGGPIDTLGGEHGGDASLDDSNTHGIIEFHQGSAEALHSINADGDDYGIADNSVDLITGAECAHWFDQDKVWQEFYRVLKPHGKVALWGYVDPVVLAKKAGGGEKSSSSSEEPIDTETYLKIYDKYTYDDERYLGPFWEQPGRNVLRQLYDSVQVPEELFTNVKRVKHDPVNGPTLSGSVVGKEIGEDFPLIVKKQWKIEELKDYVRSWSAYHRLLQAQAGKDPDVLVNLFIEEIHEKLDIAKTDELVVVWPTVYILAERK